MTATQTQIRRDTAANLASVTPALSELAHDTTNNNISIGDGARLGGWKIPNFRDIQKNSFASATAGGTANAITITLSPPLLAYGQGVEVLFKAASNNTTGVTANVNSLGTRTVVKLEGGSLVALEADDIVSGCMYKLYDTGSQFILTPMSFSATSVGGWELLAVATGGGTSYDFESVITSDYNNYVVILENLLPVSGADLLLRVKRSGQASYDAGGSDYGWNVLSVSSIGVAQSSDASDNEVELYDGGFGYVSGVCGQIFYEGLGQSNRAVLNAQLSDTSAMQLVTGLRNTTTAIQAIRLLFSTGNIASGKAYLYGIRSSL